MFIRKPVAATVAGLFIVAGIAAGAWAADGGAIIPPAAPAAQGGGILLTSDLLARMTAATREMQAIGADGAVADDDDDDGVSSLAQAGARMDANPKLHAILAKHGLTGQRYIAVMTTLARAGAAAKLAGTKWASRVGGGAPVDPRNIAFYNAHKDEVDAFTRAMGMADSAGEDDRVTQEMRSIDPDDFSDCVTLVPGIMAITPLAVRGSSAAPPSSRVKLADATADLAPNFNNLGLRKDFTTMADEIRRHAYEPRLESAAFGTALNDARQWAAQHCKGKGQ